LENVESHVLEAKAKLPENIGDIAKEVAALANHKDGAFIIGLADDGTLVGLSDSRKADERVAGVITQSAEPPVNVEIMQRSVEDTDLPIYTVPQINNTPRSVNGLYYKRVGTTVQQLSPDELTQPIQSEEDNE
jgi:predicted HTH transcriptional regulator